MEKEVSQHHKAQITDCKAAHPKLISWVMNVWLWGATRTPGTAHQRNLMIGCKGQPFYHTITSIALFHSFKHIYRAPLEETYSGVQSLLLKHW